MIDTQKLIHPSEDFIVDHKQHIDSEEKYHNSIAVGNSDLKLLERGPRVFKKNKLQSEPEEYPYKDLSYHIKMGTMIEQKLLEPDRFGENFIEQKEMNTPSSPNQKEFVDLLLDTDMDEFDAHEVAYANTSNAKAVSLYEDLEDYINFRREARGKGVYNQEEKEKITKTVGDIMSHDKASRLLIEEAPWESTWTQKPVVSEINGVLCKCLIDRLVWDGEKFYLIDLKTTDKSLPNFGYPFLRRRYYRQFAHYCRMVVSVLSSTIQNPVVKPIVVVSKKKEPYGTIVREVPVDLLHKGARELDILLRRLKWHIKEDSWDRPKEYYTNQEIRELDFDKKDIPELRL